MDFHVSDMNPFVFDSAVVDPMDVARRDCMEYFVDKILQHRGNPKEVIIYGIWGQLVELSSWQ